MPTINELRQQYPGYANLRDEEIIADMAEANQTTPDTMARVLGWEPPSFKTEAKNAVSRSLGSMVKGAGQLASDLGWESNPLYTYGKEVEEANPSRINSLEDVARYPGAAFGTGVGMAAGFLGPQLGLRAAGKGLEAYGAARAAGVVGGMPGQTVMAAAPSYGEIRDKQLQNGEDNPWLAGAGALTVGAIENLGGVQRLMGFGGKQTRDQFVRELGATPWRTVGKTTGRSMLEEGAEELVQTPVEQLAGYQDPTTAASLEEAALGGVLGAMGGVIGLPSGVSRGLQHSKINQFRQRDLLNENADIGTISDQAQWERAFLNREGQDGGAWFNDRMNSVNRRYLGDSVRGNILDSVENTSTYDYDLGPERTPIDDLLWNRRREIQAAQQAVQGGYTPDMFGGEPGYGYAPGDFTPVDLPAGPNRDRRQMSLDFGAQPELPPVLYGNQQIPYVESFNNSREGRFNKELNTRPRTSQSTGAFTQLPVTDSAALHTMLPESAALNEAGSVPRVVFPMPVDAGSAVATLEQARAQKTPIIEGSEQHQAIVRAVEILRASGLQTPGTPRKTTTAPQASAPAVADNTPPGFSKRQKEVWNEAITTLGADHPAMEVISTLIDQNKLPKAKAEIAAAKGGAAEVFNVTGLPKVQQRVLDHLAAKFSNNEVDDVLGADGWKFDEIGKQLGMKRGSVKAAVDGMRKHLEPLLTQRTAGKVESAAEDRLGLSPAQQASVVNEADLFGNPESGAEQSMGIINSIGGSQSEIGENVAPPDDKGVQTAEEVEREARIAAQARLNADIMFDELLAHPEAKNAELDWNDTRKSSSPAFHELTRGEQAELVHDYIEAATEGEWATIEATLYRFENSLEATRDAKPETTARVAGTTEAARTERSSVGVSGEVPRVEGSQPLANAPAGRGNSQAEAGEVDAKRVRAADAGGSKAFSGDPSRSGGSAFERVRGAQSADATSDADAGGAPVRDAGPRGRNDGLGGSVQTRAAAIDPSAAGNESEYDSGEVSGRRQRKENQVGSGTTGQTGEVDAKRVRARKRDDEDGRLFSRRSLTFLDNDGTVTTEEVEDLDVGEFPQFQRVLDRIKQEPLGAALNAVKHFYVNRLTTDSYAYPRPDGLYDIVLAEVVLNGSDDFIKLTTDHELAHAGEGATGTRAGFVSSRGAMGVTVARAEALFKRLGANTDLGWHLAYPFDGTHPESTDPTRRRTETLAQLVSAYTNPTLRAALQKESPALYTFAKDAHDEIVAKNQAKPTPVRDDKVAQGHVVASPVFAKGLRGQTPSFLQSRVTSLAGQTGLQVSDDLGGYASRAFKWFMSLHDLVGEYGHVLKSAKDWYASVRATIATRTQLEGDAESIAARAAKLPKHTLDKLNEFISRATFEQKWGYDAEFETTSGEKRRVTADPEMAKLFNQLPAEARQIAKDVFAHGERMKVTKFRLMKELGLKDDLFQPGTLQGPYAPLKRFGDYVAVLKSNELRAAEKAGDEKRVEQLKADPAHYVVSSFDTLGQARKFARANEDKYGWSDAFKGSVRVDRGHQMKPETLQKILASIKVDDRLDPRAKERIESMVREMYLQAFDETNARMSGLKRKNRAGYDQDMIRSFLAHARAEAGFLSHMKHGATTNELFYAMQQEAKNSKDDDRRTGQDVFNAIAMHYAANLDHRDTPIQDRLLALTSVQQLATNPAYHLQNLTQPIMVSLPRLAAQYTYAKAWTALRQGYAITREIVSGGLFNETRIDVDSVSNVKLRAMLRAAADAGLLDVGLDEDLAKFEATRTGYAALDSASGVFKTAVHRLRQVSRRVEATNRVSTAVAAFNLKYAETGNEAKATEYAISVLQDTQGDFSKTDAPLIIKRLPKFMVQYRKFQLMMMAHYVKAFRDMTRGDTAEVRAVGRRVFLFSLAHALLASGVMGLPLMNLVALAWAAAGDDDEPRDLERSLREWIGDEDTANLLLRSPLYFMGLDAKLAQDKVFSLLPYSDWNLTSKQGVTNLVTGAAGPSFANAARMAEGLGKLGEGDYYKGLAGVLPSGFANAVKAFETANKGYTLKNGDVMVQADDINTFALMLDAVGMKSPETRMLDWYKRQHWEVKQFFSDRTKEIQGAYRDAQRDGDTDAMSDLRDEWMALQDGKDRLRYLFNDQTDELKRSPLSNLLKYPQLAAKRETKLQRTVAGD